MSQPKFVLSPLGSIRGPILTTTVSKTDFNELRHTAQLSSATYSQCQNTAFGTTITKQIDDFWTSTQGYIGFDSKRKTITIVMRGSTDVTDFLNDVNTKLVTPKLSGVAFPVGVQIMEGLYTPWKAVHDSVIAEFRSLISRYPSYKLEATGHSLGGSLTYLSYIALAQNFPDKILTANAMAAFPIGNAAFAAFGQKLKGTVRRGNNLDDGTPNMYIDRGFTHYGTEYYGNGTVANTKKCNGQRDVLCSASNKQTGPGPTHSYSFGIHMGQAGCQ